MQICLTTVDSITLELAGAATTDQPEFIASYIDTTDDTPGSAKGETNDTTPVTAVAAPAADTRLVYRIDVANIDTAAVTVIVKVAGGTGRTVIRREIAAGASANLLEAEVSAAAGGSGDMTKAVYDTNDDGKVASADSADAAPWAGITGKPTTFDPAAHNHTLSDVTDAGTAAALNVAATGDAAAGEVVKGNDTRLTDARTPTSHSHTLSEVTDAGAMASKADAPSDGSEYVRKDGAWAVATGGGGGLSWSVVDNTDSPVSATSDNGYLIDASAGNVTVNLPATPTEGDTVGICDYTGSATTNTITVGRNGSNIAGAAADLTVDVDNSGFTLVYSDATEGWVIVTEISGGSTNTLSTGRNVIIGGDFTTNPWQRGTTFTSPAASTYTADRWNCGSKSTTGDYDVKKTADSPTASEAGVYTAHCYHIDVTVADTSIAASDVVYHLQAVEGLNAARFGFGQAGTRYITLSFWHKHTKTGTHCVSFLNSAANRSYVAEYTQSVSDTWEKAEITIPVDTTGTWLYDTGIGLYVIFGLLSGTTYQTTAGSWQSGFYTGTATQVNNLDNVANNFKIALVQLEAGDTATEFESLIYSDVLSRCLRYYRRIGTGGNVYAHFAEMTANDTYNAYGALYRGEMRSTATLTYSGSFALGPDFNSGAFITVETITIYYTNDVTGHTWFAASDTGGGLTAGNRYGLYANNDAAAYIAVDSEL